MSSMKGKTVFLSASIPDPDRWDGHFDAFAITDAVVATARSVFHEGGQILTAAHPTVAPLILQVADGFPVGENSTQRVLLYQSELFRSVIPDATREMMSRAYVEVVWTPAAPGDVPEPESWNRSLDVMRSRMMTETPIVAAVFIGGMEGITDEFERIREHHPDALTYSLGMPGGAAAQLPQGGPLRKELAMSDLFPWLMERVVADIQTQGRETS